MMPHEKFLILAEGNIVQMFSVWGQSSGPMLSSPELCSKRVNTDMFECNIVHYYTWINNSRAKSCKSFLSPEMHESMSAQSCQEKKKNGCNVKSDTHTHTHTHRKETHGETVSLHDDLKHDQNKFCVQRLKLQLQMQLQKSLLSLTHTHAYTHTHTHTQSQTWINPTLGSVRQRSRESSRCSESVLIKSWLAVSVCVTLSILSLSEWMDSHSARCSLGKLVSSPLLLLVVSNLATRAVWAEAEWDPLPFTNIRPLLGCQAASSSSKIKRCPPI